MFKNYKFFALVFFSITFANFSYTQDWTFYNRFEVGSQPVAIIIDSSNFMPQCYIICYGIDKNYNDIFEEGDENPSLWRLNVGFTTGLSSFSDVFVSAEKVRDFPFGFIGIPTRPAIDKDTLYLCQLGKITAYLLTGEELGEITYRKNAVAVSKKENLLFISVRESLDTNYVLIYNLQKKAITDSIPAYSMVQQTLPLRDSLIAILCEGNWGANDSKVIIAKLNDDTAEVLYTIVVGNGGNHLTYHNDLLAITTGDNMVLIYYITPEGTELRHLINLPTTGFDDVRESLFFSDSIIYTSSWDSHIYISDLKGSMPKFLDAKGKAEGFAFANFNNINFLLITNQFIQGTYLPDKHITIYTDVPITSAKDKYSLLKSRLYPNPIKDIGYLELQNTNTNENLKLEVYNLLGESLGNAEVLSNDLEGYLSIKFTKLNLQKGIYYLQVFSNGFRETIPFIKE